MPRSTLTGTRIRARRTARGMRQAELARAVGVSPSYLNLIEHNRRNVGPELVDMLAHALGVPCDALLEGAEGSTMEAARAAAAAAAGRRDEDSHPPELERIEEFLGRLPGWASVLAATHARVEELERIVEQLSDRMAHDPYLPAALHEILSAVTSVQSTAAILADGDEISPQWRQKFHTNLLSDSVRLADGAEALVNYLDASNARETGLAAPQEEMEAWLAGQGFHVAALESDAEVDLGALIEGQVDLASEAARSLALRWLERARQDALALPLEQFRAAVDQLGVAPDLLAERFGASLDRVFRRIATVPTGDGIPPVGLVLCDGSGALTFRRPIDGFALPRFGGGCPLWPMYQALLCPMRPIRTQLVTAERIAHSFTAFAVAMPRGATGFDRPAVIEAAMLLTPSTRGTGAASGQDALRVGPSCRICAAPGCAARREPSILSGTAPRDRTGQDTSADGI